MPVYPGALQINSPHWRIIVSGEDLSMQCRPSAPDSVLSPTQFAGAAPDPYPLPATPLLYFHFD
jgi:hypothetical protein